MSAEAIFLRLPSRQRIGTLLVEVSTLKSELSLKLVSYYCKLLIFVKETNDCQFNN